MSAQADLRVTIENGQTAESWTELPPGTLWTFARDKNDSAVWLRLEPLHPGRAPHNDLENLMVACAGVRRFRLQDPVKDRRVRILGRLRVDVAGTERWIDE